MDLSDLRARVDRFAAREFIRKSILSASDGAETLERLLGGRRFRCAVEIGTYRGISAAILAQFCDLVVTIDLKLGKMERDGQVFDRVRFWEALGVGNIMLHLVDSDMEKDAIIRALDFDLAFIDGDHDGDAPMHDFRMVERCGMVLMHDCDGENGVRRLLRALPREEVQIVDGMFALWQRKEGNAVAAA